MPDASKAKLMMEQGQDFTPMVQMSDSGDATTFTSGGLLWSRADTKEPVIAVNGLLTGGAVTPTANNDEVSAAAATVNLNGVQNVSVSAAGTLALTRATPTDTHIINSITVNAAGSYAVVAGTDGTSFSETRGAAGGPPLIPVDSIEIAQVRLSSNATAVVASNEIYSVTGVHTERADYPLYDIDYQTGEVTFKAALPLIHTGTVAKAVYAEYYEAILAELSRSYDYVSAEKSHSVSSVQVYNDVVASSSESLNQGSFSQLLNDGITDAVVVWKDQILWFKFFPDRNKTPNDIVQGKLGIARSFPAGDNISVACTITAESQGVQSAV